ncbi:hypothetical protein PUNSTDRAFT_98957 [Punctularia strigosozonata HHB-11173 SS5]|uniref:uncharacterized protein n=1 Tax=Punctularia strigosozonata (strain HHB-11173) TaxID=741275 RepID=UPI000441863C|nr:uncharacterized protein PUNSTDRAFT_98957 [Punctularia strigosozonata HHB-11173 SS5]EIN11734.1 hypothetical protein PUNSTDRAFT_98957 [Punctularia strigosozonata HHB-11173 SS5]
MSTNELTRLYDELPVEATHPLHSSSEKSLSVLKELLSVTGRMFDSIGSHHEVQYSDPKFVSLLRQQTNIAQAIRQSELSVRDTARALRERAGVSTRFGEDIPATRDAIPGWVVSRVEAWGRSAGMEAFRDEDQGRRIALALAGKVIVIDIEFAVSAEAEDTTIRVVSVKNSYAVPSGESANPTGNTGGSTSLDGFLAVVLQKFIDLVEKPLDDQNPIAAAQVGSRLSQHLGYLMRLDALAVQEGDAGLRWFTSIDNLASTAERFATVEARELGSSLSLAQAPLDIFLARARPLPLPYLLAPSLSFLVHLSPAAYLTLLRKSPAGPVSSRGDLPQLDVPFAHLRDYVRSHAAGVTLATLRVASGSPPSSRVNDVISTLPPGRPTFALVAGPSGSSPDHAFPLPNAQIPGAGVRWILDFTADGKDQGGIVMSQSRLREIERVVNPSSHDVNIDAHEMMNVGGGSWLDLLLDPGSTKLPPERYIAVYTSPSSKHPPLQLRLTSPEEPGFVLQHVPVSNLQQAWAVLEIVREQCWLNETLRICTWFPEGYGAPPESPIPDIDESYEATQAELEAVLNGTITPRKIPVNVVISSPTTDLSVLGPSTSPFPTRITMVAPDPSPMHAPGLGSGMLEISVMLDARAARGVRVEIGSGMGVGMGTGMDQDVLEEVCRRGGIMGLAGRAWAAAKMG